VDPGGSSWKNTHFSKFTNNSKRFILSYPRVPNQMFCYPKIVIMQRQWLQYYLKYAKVGHQQTSAFCSTDWVRSRDQFTRQQADFCLDHFFNIHYYLPPHDTTETRQPRRNGRAEEGGKRPRVGVPGTPTVFLSFFSHLKRPPELFKVCLWAC